MNKKQRQRVNKNVKTKACSQNVYHKILYHCGVEVDSIFGTEFPKV